MRTTNIASVTVRLARQSAAGKFAAFEFVTCTESRVLRKK
jgi:hypothetical protein